MKQGWEFRIEMILSPLEANELVHCGILTQGQKTTMRVDIVHILQRTAYQVSFTITPLDIAFRIYHGNIQAIWGGIDLAPYLPQELLDEKWVELTEKHIPF